MVNFCVVSGCKSESYPGCGKSFHRLPKDEQTRNKWIQALHIMKKISKCSVVCSLHFKEKDFLTAAKKKLNSNAVPFLFPDSAPVLQSSPEPAIADSTHEEAHADDSVVDADEAATRFVFSWEKPYDALPCAEESENGDDSSSVRSCAGRDDQIKSEFHNNKLHLDFKCNECDGEIIGYRYTCVQCCDVDLCGACEASGAHPEHYVLRLPRPEPAGAVKDVLETLRGLLDQELPLHLPQERIKMEVDDGDPLHEPTGLRSPEPTNDESDDYESEEQEEEKSVLETLSTDSKEKLTDAVATNTAQMQHQTNEKEKVASIVNVSSPVKKKLLPIIRISKPTQMKTLLVDSGVIKFGARVGPKQNVMARTSMGPCVGISGAGVTVPGTGVRVAGATVRVSKASVRLTGADVKVSRAGTEGMVSIAAPKRTAVVKLSRLEATVLEEAKRRKIYFDAT